jgi:hypothetical protein
MNNLPNLSELMKTGQMDGVKVDGLCSNEEMTQNMQQDPNAINFDDDIEVIPDLEVLTQTIISFLQYINTDEMIAMEINDHPGYIRHLEEKFDDFTLNYYHMFKMLTTAENRDKNVMKLLNMLELLGEIKNGNRNMQTEFEKFREDQAEEYIYPEYGGKAQFEEALTKRALKKQRKEAKKQNKK